MSVYWSVILEEYQYEEIDFENESEQVDGTHVKQQHLINMDMYVSITDNFFFFIGVLFCIPALSYKEGNVIH